MSDDRLLKQLLFKELQRTWPFHGIKNGGMMAFCLTSRPLVLTTAGILSARIGYSGINYVILRLGKWHIPEDRTAVLLTCPHKA